jgi:hypothetical protein
MNRGMQIIVPVALNPEQYVQSEYQEQIARPANCPNCQKASTLKALGYYSRFVTALLTAAVLEIWVRRFWCRHCDITVSCLPDFAQPYRVVNNPTIEDGFQGKNEPHVQRWASLVRGYWKRFEGHWPRLRSQVGASFGRCPPGATARQFWEKLKQACGSLTTATRQLVHDFREPLFATYQCHQPKNYQAG